MRTTISIDPGTLAELVKATGARSRSAALNRAAEDYVRRKKLTRLKDAWLGMETADVRQEAADADQRRERVLDGLSRCWLNCCTVCGRSGSSTRWSDS